MKNESSIYGCFLDANKAFDLVKHKILDRHLMDSIPILCLLIRNNKWGSKSMILSDPFSISNGVRQGGVHSPNLFTIIIIR